MAILVVEHDDDIRETVREILQGEGHETIGAANGQEAREILEAASEQPTLILLDLMMPVMDGWDFLMWLEADVRSCNVPVAIMSAHPSIQRAFHLTRMQAG